MFSFNIVKNNKNREIILPNLSEEQAEDLARTVRDIYSRREYDFSVDVKVKEVDD